MSDSTNTFMKRAFEEATNGMVDGRGGPFGAVIVKDGRVVATGANRVVRDHDPTAHAEVVAIRGACRALRTHVLEGATLYCTTEPCPMCLAAIYWARIDRVYYAATRDDAARIGFDDAVIYEEVAMDIEKRRLPMVYVETGAAEQLFEAWRRLPSKVSY